MRYKYISNKNSSKELDKILEQFDYKILKEKITYYYTMYTGMKKAFVKSVDELETEENPDTDLKMYVINLENFEGNLSIHEEETSLITGNEIITKLGVEPVLVLMEGFFIFSWEDVKIEYNYIMFDDKEYLYFSFEVPEALDEELLKQVLIQHNLNEILGIDMINIENNKDCSVIGLLNSIE